MTYIYIYINIYIFIERRIIYSTNLRHLFFATLSRFKKFLLKKLFFFSFLKKETKLILIAYHFLIRKYCHIDVHMQHSFSFNEFTCLI